MKLEELRNCYFEGKIDKRLYWQIVRENYTHILPEVQKIVSQNKEIESVSIQKDGIVLKKSSGVSVYFDFSQAMSRAEADMLIDGDPEKEDMRYIGRYLSEISSGGYQTLALMSECSVWISICRMTVWIFGFLNRCQVLLSG